MLDYSEQSHPKKLRLDLPITREFFDSEGGTPPLYFFALYEDARLDPVTKTEVVARVEVYRGAKKLWKVRGKMKRPWEGPLRYAMFCRTYDDGLLPGDLVVFTFKFKKRPPRGEVDDIGLLGQVGPGVMWEVSRDGWRGYDFFDCP